MPSVEATASALTVSRETVTRWQSEGAPIPEAPVGNAALDLTAIGRWLAKELERLSGRSTFSQIVLNIGFVTGLVFGGVAFAGTVGYLAYFLIHVQAVSSEGLSDSIHLMAHLIPMKMALLSCGLLSGSALGFMGFSLFLLGVQGSMNVDASGGTMQAKLVNVAPGTLLLLCSAVLIGLCSTSEFELSFVPRAKSPETTDKPGEASQPTERSIEDIGLAHFSESQTTFDDIVRQLTGIQARFKPEKEEETIKELSELAAELKYLPNLFIERAKELDSVAIALRPAKQLKGADFAEKQAVYSRKLAAFYKDVIALQSDAAQIQSVLAQKKEIAALASELENLKPKKGTK